jgi:hypothetical protein
MEQHELVDVVGFSRAVHIALMSKSFRHPACRNCSLSTVGLTDQAIRKIVDSV